MTSIVEQHKFIDDLHLEYRIKLGKSTDIIKQGNKGDPHWQEMLKQLKIGHGFIAKVILWESDFYLFIFLL